MPTEHPGQPAAQTSLIDIPGLISAEAAERAASPDHNPLTFRIYRPTRRIWRDNLFTSFNLNLLGMMLAMYLLGNPLGVLSSVFVLFLSVTVNVGREFWARRRMTNLEQTVRPRPSVIRDGQIHHVEMDEVVLGDAAIIRPGDQLLADGVLISPGEIVVDETMLRGGGGHLLREKGDPVFATSLCLQGHGVYEVQKLGGKRRIDELLASQDEDKWRLSPLQKMVQRILRTLLIAVWIAAIMLTVAYLSGNTGFVEEEIWAAVSIVFGLAPGTLFLTIFVSYSFGSAFYLSQIDVLTPRPLVVEALNAVDTLCLGKTGILTGIQIELDIPQADEGQETMSAAQLRDLLGDFARSFPGWVPALQSIINEFDGEARSVVEAGGSLQGLGWLALTFDEVDLRGTFILGYPAVLAAHIARAEEKDGTTGEDNDKRTSVLQRASQRARRLFSRQSADVVDEDKNTLQQAAIDGIDSRAVDLVFFHHAEALPLKTKSGQQPELPPDLSLLATVQFYEGLRPEAHDTLQEMTDTGVQSKMLASDAPEKVATFAEQLGIVEMADEGNVITGAQLDAQTSEELVAIVENNRLFSSLGPEQKVKVIEMLREGGHYVAMAGENVADLGAMRAAEVSIARAGGALATIGTADLVVLKNTLSVLPLVFREGRRIFNGVFSNLRLSLSQIGYQLLLLLVAIFPGVRFPYLPEQLAMVSVFGIVWPSFATTVLAPTEPSPKISLQRRLTVFVVPAAVCMSLLAQAISITFVARYGSDTYAQSGVIFGLFAASILLVLFTQPPGPAWYGAETIRGDRRLILWELASIPAFLIVLSLPIIQNSTKLTFLQSAVDYAIVAAYVAAWWLVLRSLWRWGPIRGFSERASRLLETE